MSNYQQYISVRDVAITFVLCIFHFVSNGQSETKEANLFRLWHKVYQYELKGLPKSAAKVVDSIYQISQQKGYTEQKLKAVMYQSKFILILDENGEDRLFQKLQEEIASSAGLEKALLHSFLACVYNAYKEKNQWKIRNRSAVTQESNDHKTWTVERLQQAIEKHYQASISNAAVLQATDISAISELVTHEVNSETLRPTVYDLLCHKTIDFYLQYNYYLPNEYKHFDINTPTCFEQGVDEYARIYSKTYLYKALSLLESLSQYHLEHGHIGPMIDVTLQRLKLLKEHASFESIEQMYFRELEKLKSQYENNEFSTLIDYEMAQVYYNQGMSFPQDESNRWKLKKARTVCLEAEARFPRSLGVRKCADLLHQIEALQLNIEAEKYIPMNTHSKLLVTYKNIDSLNVKIYLTDDEFIKSYRGISNDSIKNFFKHKKEISNESYALIDDLDFQKHSTEVPLPKLPAGNYVIMTSSINDSGETVSSHGFIRATNVALLSITPSTFQLINRLNGAPLAGAQISIYSDQGTRFEYQDFSDESGFFELKAVTEWRNYVAKVKFGNDSTQFDNIYVYRNRISTQEAEELIVKPVLFTDRSIYRPGQTVYFKGILVKKQGERKELVKNELVEVYLEDPNDSEIGESIILRTNEFGSFSGTFQLPKTGLTGRYAIYVEEGTGENSELYDKEMDDFDYYEHTISVEEYKRPKFSVHLDPIDTTYSLGDRVTILGKAMAFAGSSISNAEIKYTVSRHVQYPSWYYWGRGYGFGSSVVEVASGKSQTMEDGSFAIDFLAIPDSQAVKKDLPVFVYELALDVTDINGETRSAQMAVNIGYHQYDLTIAAPDKVDIDQKLSLIFKTTNLNKVHVPAMVAVEIYKEEYSAHVLRNRPWAAPDRPILSTKEFENLFPHENYSGQKQEAKGEVMYQGTVNTNEMDPLILDEIRHWEQGNYLITATIKDSAGLDVVSKKQIMAYSSKRPSVGDNQAFVIQKDRSTYTAGDKVKLTVGSAADELHVTLFFYVNGQLLTHKVTTLHHEVKSVDFLLPKTEATSASVYYSYSFMNAHESGSIELPVAKKNDRLTIETQTFRDRLIPGGEETWSFTVSDVKDKRVKAEVLASMYDQSLDEFKPHAWRFMDFDEGNYYGGLQLNSHYSFGTKRLNTHNASIHFRNTYQQKYGRLEHFGFNFRNPENGQKRYLQTIGYYRKKASNLLLDYDSQVKKGFIYGTVVDKYGDGIAGVSILKKGTTTGAVTDMQGNFSLKIKKGEVLEASFVGYETQVVTIGKYNKITIQMNLDVQNLEEVVVVGYGVQEKKSMTASVTTVDSDETVIEDIVFDSPPEEELAGSVAGLQVSAQDSFVIRGNGSIQNGNSPLYVVDGVIVTAADMAKGDVISMQVLKGEEGIAIYGARAANGVVIITTKSGQNKLAQEMAQVKARTNLKETAFFYPHITANKKGVFEFKFTTPESLTRWNLQLFAHDDQVQQGIKRLEALSQKDLMVFPNPPRFLRQGDEITLQAKVANLTSKEIEGQVSLLLIDPMTDQAVDASFKHEIRTLPYKLKPNGNATVSWDISVPDDFDLIQYKVVAKSGQYSDGESQVLPILSNRQLITETLPVWANGNETRAFELENLKTNSSSTLSHHQLTFEMTEDPTWYAIQSLPYLLEFSHECAEQTFARYYANLLGVHILKANPKIKAVLDQWRNDGSAPNPLEQNEQLKAVLIEETPWLRDAQSEAEKNARLSALLEFSKTEQGSEEVLSKLLEMKTNNGGYPWFSGGAVNRTITQHIVAGFGHLHALGVAGNWNQSTSRSLLSSVKYLERELTSDYQKLLERAAKQSITKDSSSFMQSMHLGFRQIQGLYARSFYDTIAVSEAHRESMDYFIDQAERFWIQYTLNEQVMMALILARNQNAEKAREIMASIKENSTSSEEFGVYWKSNQAGWRWYQSPIETQALLIEAFHELHPEDQTFIEKMNVWLLRNKQTNSWPTTRATTDAIYALLLSNDAASETAGKVSVRVGGQLIESSEKVAGTGYSTINWSSDEIHSNMANVSITNTRSNTVWGALYWQYFEGLDQVKTSNSSWSIEKQVLLKTEGTDGVVLKNLSDSVMLSVGDLVTVRLVLKTDRDAEFVHLKDQRAAGFEPVDVLSAYKWQDGVGYYQSTRDTGTHFFFDRMKKGTYVFEYDLRVNNAGQFSNGIATLQSMYAPEFSGHSSGVRLLVK